jgi:hypothetical protein
MNTTRCQHPPILWVDRAPLPANVITAVQAQQWTVRVECDEDEAMDYLRTPGIELAVIAANQHMLRHPRFRMKIRRAMVSWSAC